MNFGKNKKKHSSFYFCLFATFFLFICDFDTFDYAFDKNSFVFSIQKVNKEGKRKSDDGYFRNGKLWKILTLFFDDFWQVFDEKEMVWMSVQNVHGINQKEYCPFAFLWKWKQKEKNNRKSSCHWTKFRQWWETSICHCLCRFIWFGSVNLLLFFGRCRSLFSIHYINNSFW